MQNDEHLKFRGGLQSNPRNKSLSDQFLGRGALYECQNL